jgi:hypothetical protein
MVRDGVVYASPRGRKVWAPLAYVALSDRRGLGRTHLLRNELDLAEDALERGREMTRNER